MRDIRGDLQDRVHLIEEQISAAHAQFEKRVEQLKSERDGRVEELKSELAAIGRLMEAEHRRLAGAPPPQTVQAPQATPAQGPMPLADFLVRKLNEHGPLSKEDLRLCAVQEGYFSDPESAERGVHAALATTLRAARIRQLPNGDFAPATVMDTIRLRRAV